ncbi:FKBP-type peptidyl-prolyl cis-trans isomerase [Agromyces aerolatus]|uniref:FKBP-type peptidyl-prolyl cis-trans isomerase n=1 Tax=Agromyces sp. LY-1074 TaxID=3074080 RepID=UPI0028643189|nr:MULTISPECIES: FKBP-type peptidyl-prolyl cis-trans isomerase [unclassified Agromyces]MDR5698606.1 FKBP-type peptidyl-prolyl cis-trans isomerase [Agromyces sp. LY-1074]MDR5704900.1 FKBP-type peptidyl-prolyl cis-trans isomerase [Agromyces sp. LY-1358]
MNRALRLAAPVALAAASALVLAGCASGDGSTPASTTPAAAAGECMDVSSGSLSDGVTADGAFGEVPNATFDTPAETEELQRSILIEGEGDATEPGQEVDVVLTMYSGTSGEQLISQPVSLGVGESTLLTGFRAAIDCVPVGTRTATVAPAADVYGEQGNESIGVAPGEAVVIVADVTGITEETPPPTPSEWTENVPEVTFNGDEPPTVTIPDTEPPTELLLTVLEEGDGETVEAGNQVTVKYQGQSWNTKEIFDQSYPGEARTFGTDQVIPGFGAALVGQKVGTKLIVTIPPELAYGTDPSVNLGGQTLVFLIEIEGTTAA